MTRRAILPFVLVSAACGAQSAAMTPEVTPDASSNTAPDASVQETPKRSSLLLDDFEGGGVIPVLWSLNSSPGASISMKAPEPPRGASRQALHVTLDPAATGADVFTHHHFDWTQMFVGVRFWVRADDAAGAEVAVSVTSPVSVSHADALAAGSPWLMVRLRAGQEWAQVTARFDMLQPEGPGTPQPTFGDLTSELHFLAPLGGSSAIWLDDIELLCPDAGC